MMFDDYINDYDVKGPFDKEDKDKVLRVGNTIAENHVNDNRGQTAKYGLCHECRNFEFVSTLYGKEYTACDYSKKVIPSCIDPIKTCSNYYPKGQLDLNAMFALAYNISDNKKSVGFKLVSENEEVKKHGNE